MSTIGKKYRRVPIVYPALIDEALKSLVENRHFCGILPDNPFLFPNSVGNHIRGCDVLRELVEKCELKHTLHKPSLIKSTLLRKHVATIAQILVLSGDDLGDLSNHLGHSEEVHKTFYRQQESMIEKTKITKMLELINTGTVAKYKGKSLVDVTLEDVINAATDHVNREEPDVDDDEDDPNSDINDNHEDNNPVPSEQISLPSTSKCNPSYPKNNTNSKQKRLFWSKELKDAIGLELGDCINDIKNLTHERAINFLAKHNIEERGFLKLKNVIYNMQRPSRKN